MRYQVKFLTYNQGLSLVEMVVVIALLSTLMLAITNATTSFYRLNAYTISQAYEVGEAQRGIEIMIRDLREMTYADDGTFPLAIMTAHKVAFYSDIDRDDSVEYVEYELGTTTLEKRVFNATGSPPVYNVLSPDSTFILSEFVQNINLATSTFEYYDQNGNLATPTSTVTDIRYIRARIIVNIDLVRNPGEFTLRSSATLRNIKDNL